MKEAAAIRRDINPAGLLSGRSFRNEKRERASRGKRITSRGIDHALEKNAEIPIHRMKYPIFLSGVQAGHKERKGQKKEKAEQNKEFINCCPEVPVQQSQILLLP